jgi:hypothetical protein
METKSSLPCSREITTSHCPGPDESSPHCHTILFRYDAFQCYSLVCVQVLLSGRPAKIWNIVICPIHSYLPMKLMESTNYGTPQYAVLSRLLSLQPLQVEVFPQCPVLRHLLFVLPLTWEILFHTYTKQHKHFVYSVRFPKSMVASIPWMICL